MHVVVGQKEATRVYGNDLPSSSSGPETDAGEGEKRRKQCGETIVGTGLGGDDTENAVSNAADLPIRIRISRTFRLVAKPDVLLMVPAFGFTGMLLSFWLSIYPTSLAATLQFQQMTLLITNGKTLMSLNMVSLGLGQITGGLLLGMAGRAKKGRLERQSLLMVGFAALLLAFIGVLANVPTEATISQTSASGWLLTTPSVVLALTCGFLLGLGDCCFYSQVSAHLIACYGGPKGASGMASDAFALFYYFRVGLVHVLQVECHNSTRLDPHVMYNLFLESGAHSAVAPTGTHNCDGARHKRAPILREDSA